MSQTGTSGESEFAERARALARFRAVRLRGEPSDRALAKAAGVSPQTVGDWLRGKRFPQEIGKIVAIVRTIAAAAADRGISTADAEVPGLLDEDRWRDLHDAELRRRAGRVSGSVRRAQALSVLAGAVGSRLLDEVTDPFALEVHRPVQPGEQHGQLPVLPAYVPRGHDRKLAGLVQAAASGHSGIAVLVSGSSTGKTRACWEALQALRDRPETWRLWHPIDPSRPEAALGGLPLIRPRTVVWLNEAQFYLDVEGGIGEQVAAGLRELLRDPSRAPVLVLATMWPQFWETLTQRPSERLDQHEQARELLSGHDITVPEAFTQAQLEALRESGDPRLAAAAGAEDGRVIQYLAGAPELLSRYRNARLPGARALIEVAMDARRLGMRVALPLVFLEAAAPDYLTGKEWDQLADDWLEQALAYTAVDCKGARGPLTRIRPRHGRDDSSSTSGSAHRLADYLDEAGRRIRREQLPPATFWAAAAAHAHPAEMGSLGDAAYDRGLYRDAAQFHKNAAGHGDTAAASHLVARLHLFHPSDQRAAQWAASHAVFEDTYEAAALLRDLQEAGAAGLAAVLAGPAADHAALSNPYAVSRLLRVLRTVGGAGPVTVLAQRAANSLALDYPDAVVTDVLAALKELGAADQAAALARRIVDQATRIALDNPSSVRDWLAAVRQVSGLRQAADLARRAVPNIPLSDPYAIGWLLEAMQATGAEEQVRELAGRAAAQVPLGDTRAVTALLRQLRQLGAEDQLAVLANRASSHVPLNDPIAISTLLGTLTDLGALTKVTALLARNPGVHACLDNPSGVARLLSVLRKAGGGEQVSVLARRAAADAPLQDPQAVVALLSGLQNEDTTDQVSVLLARDLADDADLSDPGAVAALLSKFRRLDAAKQATALLRRDPASHVTVASPYAVASLLYVLADAGAAAQVGALADRAADHTPLSYYAGLIDLLEQLERLGAKKQIMRLAQRIADRAPLEDRGDLEDLEKLLNAMRWMGATKQADTLINRMPAAGLFVDFLMHTRLWEHFRFGREPDGQPARPWGWDDLD